MKVMIVFGTRPEGIKMAPLVKAFQKESTIQTVVVNTGQHKEMLDQVLELFEITPDYNLAVMRQGQTLESVSVDVLNALSPVLTEEKPDLVLVHGDTTTTFIGAYAAFLQQIPVGHVEAGLRTYEHYSPFPEEMNRSLVGRIAHYHFAATETNLKNLLGEHVNESQIAVVGNSVIDALFDILKKPHTFSADIENVLNKNGRVVLMTTHRRENLEQLDGIYKAINRIVEEHPDVDVIFPIHKNPKVRDVARAHLNNPERIHLVEPLDYMSFCHLMNKAYLILTDSGGVQEEAPALGKPVLVTRNSTERPEGVAVGTLKLVGTKEDVVYNELKTLLTSDDAYAKMSHAKNPYGDGTTCEQIVSYVKQHIMH
ncbi:MAG: non-hydrolyzing UDP-N-acetylglucosamine 2-epimerase [Bacilli bacterium]